MSENPIFLSNRRFILFSFSSSHGLLLLRSQKSTHNTTRIDILLQDVRALEIRCWFDGVTIIECEQDYLIGFRSKPAEMIEPGNRVYSVGTNNWQGFVVGGILSVREDEGDYMTPSGLI